MFKRVYHPIHLKLSRLMKRKNVTKPTTIPSNQPGNAFGYVHLLGLVQWVCRLAVGRRERGRGSRGGEKREKKKKL